MEDNEFENDIEITEHKVDSDKAIYNDTSSSQINQKKKFAEYQIELSICYEKANILKEQGNRYFKEGNYKKAKQFYKDGKVLIEQFQSKNYTISRSFPITDLGNNFNDEYLNICSNLSNSMMKLNEYNEAIENDLYIISAINPNKDKCYVRLIQCYLNLNKIEEAAKCGKALKLLPTYNSIKNKKEVISINEKLKSQQFDYLENKIKTQSINNFAEDSLDNISEITSKLAHTKRKRRHKSIFNYYATYFLGGFFVIGGILSFYFIFRNNSMKMIRR